MNSCNPVWDRAKWWVMWCVVLWWSGLAWVGGQEVPMGPLGGRVELVPGTGLLRVVAVSAGGPAQVAGVQVGDFIAGAGGRPFGVTGASSGSGYVGAVQDFGVAVDRAEGRDGKLVLDLVRGGVGGLVRTVQLPAAGAFGAAWPAGSAKADGVYETCVAQIHSRVQASSSGNFGYTTGWFGLILLSHPDWAATSGARPYRNSINKLRVRCEEYLNGRVLEPAEAFIYQNGAVVANPLYVDAGLENWDVCSSAMFLAAYRLKSGDGTADAVVQRAAEMIAHRIQSWTQYDDPPEPHVAGGGIGRMGHGGVHGDYSHYDGTGALNIINAHAMVAMGLLKQAGANMGRKLGASINDLYSAVPIQPTIEEKFRICWDWMKQATTTSGDDDGNVGYVGKQSGWDSAGRTPGVLAGWKLYGMAATADDLDKLARQEAYIARRWFRQQHAHAYTLGGVALSQLAMPFMSYRNERFFQENSRFYAVLARQPDGSIAYFPGRENNGGDGYLDNNRVALVNVGIAGAVRSGRIPGFPLPDAGRIHVEMVSPYNDWPVLAARRVELNGGLEHGLEMRVLGADGGVVDPSGCVVRWTHVSGPGAVVFSDRDVLSPGVSVPQAGIYRVKVNVTRGAVAVEETYDLVVTAVTAVAGVVPYVVGHPGSGTVDLGGSLTLAVTAQGTGPLLYQWRRNGVLVGTPSVDPQLRIDNASAGSGGNYDCVVTNAYGSVASQMAVVTVSGVGGYGWGGLWRDVFTGISGSTVANLTSAAVYPNRPDVSGVLASAESPAGWGDNYGQRWSGWITPPQSGNYRFYIASDDASQLWLSTTASRANRVMIAQVTGYVSARAWGSGGVSANIALVGGKRYYIEVLHKEGTGGDHCAITWNWRSAGVWSTPVNGSAPLPGAVLEHQVGGTLDDAAVPPVDYAPLASDQVLTVFGGVATPVTLVGEDFEKAPLVYQISSGPGKGSLSGTAPDLVYTPNAGASGSDEFRFTVSDGVQTSLPGVIRISLVPETADNLQVWLGKADASWGNTANWLSGVVTTSSKAVVFDARLVANPATTLAANTSARRIVVLDPPQAVAVAGNTLTLGDGIQMLGATRDLTVSSAVSTSAAQAWTVGDGAALTVSGAISGNRALTKDGAGVLVLNGVSPTTGGWTVAGGTLELRGGGWYAGHVGGTGTVTVQAGATVVNYNSHSFGSSENPTRSLVVQGGRFRLRSETYVNGVTLNGGVIDNLPGESGDLRVRTSGNTVTVQAAAAASVIACGFNLTGNSVFNVADGTAAEDLRVSGVIAGSKALTKSGAGRMVVAGNCSYTGAFGLSGGRLVVLGSLAAGTTLTVLNDTVLEGTGTVAGTVKQTGDLEPGYGGTAVFTLGKLEQNAAADTRVELGGEVAGIGYDRLAVTGGAILAGVLDVTLLNGYVPPVGARFDVLTALSRSGVFADIRLPELPADRLWQVQYDPDGKPGLRLAVAAVEIPPYTQWKSTWFGAQAGDASIAGDLADPDADGLPNLLEYGLALDPTRGIKPADGKVHADFLPRILADAAGWVFQYRRNPAASDLIFTVEVSSDLGEGDAWRRVEGAESVSSGDDGTEIVRVVLPESESPTRYVRLRVGR